MNYKKKVKFENVTRIGLRIMCPAEVFFRNHSPSITFFLFYVYKVIFYKNHLLNTTLDYNTIITLLHTHVFIFVGI